MGSRTTAALAATPRRGRCARAPVPPSLPGLLCGFPAVLPAADGPVPMLIPLCHRFIASNLTVDKHFAACLGLGRQQSRMEACRVAALSRLLLSAVR